MGDGPAPAGGVLKHFFLRISQLLSMKKVDRKQQKIQAKTKRWGANQPLESPTTRFRKSAIEKTPETTARHQKEFQGSSSENSRICEATKSRSFGLMPLIDRFGTSRAECRVDCHHKFDGPDWRPRHAGQNKNTKRTPSGRNSKQCHPAAPCRSDFFIAKSR